KWDLLGVHYYIDNELIHTNDLWHRHTNTESMNIVLTNQVFTNTGDPDQNPENNTYDNTSVCDENNQCYQVVFSDPFISNEKLIVDWVKVYQGKKFDKDIVWASGKSDRIGGFILNQNSNDDVFLIGNFLNNNEQQIL